MDKSERMNPGISSVPAGGPGRHQRQLRNLLLDRHFQLKYSGYLVGITLAVSGLLGVVLWQTSQKLLQQSEVNAVNGDRIVRLGTAVVEESRKVSAVVRMNIVKDPVYQDNPELLAAFNSDADEQDRRLDEQQAQLSAQRAALARDVSALRATHGHMFWAIVSALGTIVIAVGVAGIVMTHKVAGPVYKMTRHFRAIADGNFEEPRSLRKGDELVAFFSEFQAMVVSLNSARRESIRLTEEALASAGSPDPEVRSAALQKLAAYLRGSGKGAA